MCVFPGFGLFRRQKLPQIIEKKHYVYAGFVARGPQFWGNKPFFGVCIQKGALLEHFFGLFGKCFETQVNGRAQFQSNPDPS